METLLRQERQHALAGAGDDVRGDQAAEAFHLRLARVDGRATAATSPLINTVMYPPPSFSRASTSTAAVFKAVSMASKTAVNPWVSMRPTAKLD